MTRVAMISYGEVGGILAAGLRQAGVAGIRVHDTAPTARARAIAAEWCDTHAQAVDSADLVIVAVTAASALEAVRSFAPSLSRETFVLDVNSVSPATKQAAAETVERAGGRYVEAAVMTSVPPRGLASPMLLGGPHASVVHGSGGGAEALGDVGDRYPQPRMPIVPFKLNQDRRHHIPRQGHRVTNWPAYDASLRQRGSLTVWFTDEVRHITWRWIPFAERRRGLEEMTLGPAAYPVVKAKRDSSMPSKRERSEDAYGRVPQGPRNMLRTGLFEPQPPAMQVNVPRHSVLCRGHRDRTTKSSPSEPSTWWAMGRHPIQGGGRGTYVALDTSSTKGMWDRPPRREAQGDGAAIVLRGRESRPHGEGRQVS